MCMLHVMRPCILIDVDGQPSQYVNETEEVKFVHVSRYRKYVITLVSMLRRTLADSFLVLGHRILG